MWRYQHYSRLVISCFMTSILHSGWRIFLCTLVRHAHPSLPPHPLSCFLSPLIVCVQWNWPCIILWVLLRLFLSPLSSFLPIWAHTHAGRVDLVSVNCVLSRYVLGHNVGSARWRWGREYSHMQGGDERALGLGGVDSVALGRSLSLFPSSQF